MSYSKSILFVFLITASLMGCATGGGYAPLYRANGVPYNNGAEYAAERFADAANIMQRTLYAPQPIYVQPMPVMQPPGGFPPPPPIPFPYGR